MLLGKRSRHSNPTIKRTTSMTRFTFDVSNAAAVDDVQTPILSDPPPHPHNPFHHEFPNANFGHGYDQSFLAAMVSPSSTNHVVATPSFLRSCCLCQRRLAPGRDIYMYRGDAAFCSQECREVQMKQDEKKKNG